MRIGIVGAGPVGRAIGGTWTAAGHDVRYGVRRPAEGPGQTPAWPTSAGPTSTGSIPTVSVPDALDAADAVLLAVPGAAVPDLLDLHAAALDGRLVVDATNLMGAPTLHQVPLLTERMPGARIARAFCTVGWEVLADPVFDGQPADLFWCGVDDPAVAGLITDTGARPVRIGGLDAADVLDGVARLWFALAFGQGRGRAHGMRVLDR